MASRGQLGGLAWATPQALRVLDAAGCDVVLIETVGVGQAEVEVAWLADTTVVLLAPGMGDGIQAAKAGILEVGDVYVVNKADRDGADQVVRDLRSVLNLARQGRRLAAADREDRGADRQGDRRRGRGDRRHRARLAATGELTARAARARGEIEAIAVTALRPASATCTVKQTWTRWPPRSLPGVSTRTRPPTALVARRSSQLARQTRGRQSASRAPSVTCGRQSQRRLPCGERLSRAQAREEGGGLVTDVVKKSITVLVVAFAAFYLFTQPSNAADAIQRRLRRRHRRDRPDHHLLHGPHQ